MSLPQKLPLELMQTKWAAQINPLLSNPIMQGLMITDITLPVNTPTVIPTGLNRMQQGWFLVDNQANCRIWRTADFNPNNLTLEATADTVISIWVF